MAPSDLKKIYTLIPVLPSGYSIWKQFLNPMSQKECQPPDPFEIQVKFLGFDTIPDGHLYKNRLYSDLWPGQKDLKRAL